MPTDDLAGALAMGRASLHVGLSKPDRFHNRIWQWIDPYGGGGSLRCVLFGHDYGEVEVPEPIQRPVRVYDFADDEPMSSSEIVLVKHYPTGQTPRKFCDRCGSGTYVREDED